VLQCPEPFTTQGWEVIVALDALEVHYEKPVERLWKWFRRAVTHNHWFETLQEELQAIRDFFCYLAGRKDDGRHLCAIKTPESLVALL
jgi:hypothetical protein